jgi:hypothetical protein
VQQIGEAALGLHTQASAIAAADTTAGSAIAAVTAASPVVPGPADGTAS